MRPFFTSLLLLLPICAHTIPVAYDSEEAQLERLILCTKTTLNRLELLQKELHEFRKQETICLALDANAPTRQDKLYQLSVRALSLFQLIAYTNTEDLFRPSFLEDLRKLSKMAENKSLPKVSKEVIE